MDVNCSFLKPFPNFLRGVPGARHVGEHEPSEGPCGIGPEDNAAQTKNAAQDGSGQLRFPVIDFLDMFQEFNITLHHPGPGDVIPAPELWCGRTGNASDGGFATFMVDGDAAALPVRQRLSATLAFTEAGQKITSALSLR